MRDGETEEASVDKLARARHERLHLERAMHRALHALELALLVAICIDIAYMILRKPAKRIMPDTPAPPDVLYPPDDPSHPDRRR
jgi:hypothetical protein